MSYGPLPDDLSELERELEARRRQPPSAGFGRRLSAAVERELAGLARRRWRLVVAAGMAAAVIIAAFILWNRNGHAPRPGSETDSPPLIATLPVEPDSLLTWRAGRIMGDSPEALEIMRKRWSVEDRREPSSLRAFTRIETELLNSKGDM
jgi:hypothetical protein